ncbi:MAG: beta-N-acetylhexosaminidase [Alphaproteobacteria bacterium]
MNGPARPADGAAGGGPDLPDDRLAVVFGCAGTALSDDECRFFRRVRPLGFILFARNCAEPAQVAALVADMRAAVGDPFVPVLIDQEGGRVERLKPPHWRHAPPASAFGQLFERDAAAATEAAHLNARLIAADLDALGITVDCAPVLDLLLPETHRAIGDRAFAARPERVAALGAAVRAGLEAGGVTPVIKHLPGHGRATVDSHADLPRIAVPRATLENDDFAPFRALRNCPWGIVGHLLIEAIDPDRPASLSPAVIDEAIRGAIGFDGVLATDDINMGALGGDLGWRTRALLDAGCDVVLHCNGDLDQMHVVAAAAGRLTAAARMRLLQAERRRLTIPRSPLDREHALARLEDLLGEAGKT